MKIAFGGYDEIHLRLRRSNGIQKRKEWRTVVETHEDAVTMKGIAESVL